MYLAFCYQESPIPHVSSYSCLSLPLQPIPLHLRGLPFLLPCQRRLRRMSLPRTSFYLPRSLREPLVITDKNAYGNEPCFIPIERDFIDLITKVAISKIILFIKEGVKGSMHLAIYTEDAAVCTYCYSRIVIFIV